MAIDKTIFVVDDVGVNLSVTKTALDSEFNVVTSSSGEKALKLMTKIRPDLILLDIDMPEIDGFEVLEIIKRKEEYANIPVIFLTAMTDGGVKEKGYKLGAVDFIGKPFSPGVLMEIVKRYLN